jgi:peptide/nickel transport system ATP-binding protein
MHLVHMKYEDKKAGRGKAPGPSGPIMEIRDVYKLFRVRGGLFGRRLALQAVRGVSLTLFEGEALGIVGESGCGKTTLAQMMLGLLHPTSGEILLRGKPIGMMPRGEVTKIIQPVFQDPYSSLNPRKTAMQIISLPLRTHRIGNRAEREQLVLEIMDKVGLSRSLSRSLPGQLSGGQRQRVAIARALVMRPSVVVCDEPTSALDVSVQAQILNLLMDLRDEFNLTYILVSHNLAVVRHVASRVMVMYLGRIVEEGPTEQIFREPLHPYTQALLSSALTPEPGLGIPDTHLGATFPDPLNPPTGCAFHPRCPRKGKVCSQDPPPLRILGNQKVECHYPDSPHPMV